jgi:hypothetical protein
MSKQRIVKDEIWGDEWFYSQAADQKLVWLYLLTNDRCNVAGVYKLNRAWAAKALNIKPDRLDTILEGFEEDFRCTLYQEWIFLTNFYKHQSKSPKIKAGVSRILNELPRQVQEFMASSDRVCIEYRTLLNSTLLNSTLPDGEDPFATSSKKYSEKDMAMAELLTSLIKKNYPDWQLRGNMETWAEHIEKLHRIDKRTYEQIEYMIRWTQAHNFWRQNILSTSKLRDKFNELIPKLREDIAKRQRQAQTNHNPIL